MGINFRTAALAVLAAAGAAVAAPATAAPVLFAGNGHYYDFIQQNVSWNDALAAADASTYLGLDGYLVTITSADEDNFIKALTGSATYVWAAGSDQGQEGVWRWMAGPELGMIFFGPGAAPGAYSHWNSGEPNNNNSENYLHIKANAGDWNDIYPTFGSGGYVIEYSGGAVPEPSAWAMMIVGFGAAGALLRRRRTALA